LCATGWYEWLAKLKVQEYLKIPGGKTLLAVHATPGNDDGVGVHAHTPTSQLKELTSGTTADIICVGHTHDPCIHRFNGQVIVNPGSTSISLSDDRRASYAVVRADRDTLEVEHVRVEYDISRVVSAVSERHYPVPEFAIACFNGTLRIEDLLAEDK